jgi:hypothetical protein
VPDMDVLRLGFRGPWRKPARLTKSGAARSTVAHHLSDALAQTVRQKGGCPGLNDLLDAARTNQGLWDQPDSRLQAAELSENDHVRMAADVLRSRLAAGNPLMRILLRLSVRLKRSLLDSSTTTSLVGYRRGSGRALSQTLAISSGSGLPA